MSLDCGLLAPVRPFRRRRGRDALRRKQFDQAETDAEYAQAETEFLVIHREIPRGLVKVSTAPTTALVPLARSPALS